MDAGQAITAVGTTAIVQAAYDENIIKRELVKCIEKGFQLVST